MAFGAQIKLSVDKSNKSQFRGQIQQLVNEISTSNPIKLKNFKVDLSGREKQQIINQLQEALRNTDIEIKIKSIDASSAVANLRKQLTTMLSGLRIEGLKEFLGDTASTQALENATKAAKNLAAAQGDVKKKAKEANAALKEINAINSVLSGTNKKILNLGDAEGVDELKAKYRELSAELDRAKNQEGELQAKTIAAVSAETSALVSKVNAIRQAAAEAKRASSEEVSSTQDVENAIKRLNVQRANLSKRVETYITNNPRAYEAYRSEFDAIRASLAEISDDAPTAQRQLLEVSEQFADITTQAKVSGNAGKTFFTTLREGWQKFGGWSIITKSMMMAVNGFKNMVSAVKELDAAMTELRKVTDLTDSAYNKFYQGAVNRARSVGATLSDTINATADFSRLGYNINDAASLAQAALTYKNVGDGINNISEATESLISTLKAFYADADDVSEAATHIIDAFNEVGNNFAISSTGIGEALQRSAAALSSAGNSLEESIGLITAANNIVQNPEQVGTALKTLSMYLRAAKTEAEEAGLETDGMADSVSKLRDQILALTGNKVDIQIDENTFKSTYQIIKEISEVWDDLSDISRANLTELMGGKRNANVLTALIKNFGDAEKAAKTAMESIGSAARENEKYLNSIAGKVAQMQAAFQAFSGSALDSSIIKFFVDLGTAMLNVGTAITNLHLLVPTITAIATAVRGISLGNKVNNLITQFTTQVNAGVPDETIMTGLSRTLGTMTVAQQKFAISQLQSAAAAQTLSPTLQGQIGTLTALTSATSGTATAGNMLKTVWAGVKATFSSFSGILLVVQLVISGIQMLVDAHNQSIQESIDKANEYIDNFTSANKNYASSIKTLNGLEEKFNELSEGVDENGKNVSLTSEEYKQYLSIIDQIINISPQIVSGYTEQGDAVMNYKTALQDAIDVQKQYIENQKSIYLGSGKEIFTGKQNEYKQILRGIHNEADDIYNAMQLGFFSDMSSRWSPITQQILGIGEFNPYENDMNSDDFANKWLRIYEKRKEIIDALSSLQKETGKGFEPVYTHDQIKALESEINDLAQYYTQVEAIRTQQAEYLTTWASAQDWYSDIPMAAYGGLSKLLADINDPLKSYNENIKLAEQYGAELASYFTTDGAGILTEMAKGLQDGTVDVDSFNESLGFLNDTWSGSAGVLQLVMSYWRSFIPTANSTGQVFENLDVKVNKLSDSLKQMKDGYSVLETAQKEMGVDGSGSLSTGTVSTMLGMLKDGEKITDYIYAENGLLKLNADAWRDRSEALIEADIDEYNEKLSKLLEYERAYYAVYDKEGNMLAGVTDADLAGLDAVIEKYGITIDQEQSMREEYVSMITLLRALRSSMYNDTEDTAKSFTDVLSIIESASSFLTNMGSDSADALSMIEAAMNLASKVDGTEWTDFVKSFNKDGIEWNADAIREFTDALVDQIPNIGELEGMYPGITQYLKDLCTAEAEAAAEAQSLSDVLSTIDSASSFLTNMGKDKAPIDMLQSAISLASKVDGKSWTDFVASFSADGGIEWNADAVREFTDALVDQIPNLGELESLYPGITQYLKDMATAESEAAKEAMSLSDVLSTISSASSFLTSMNKEGTSALDMIESAVSLASKVDGKNFADFIGGFSTEEGITWDTDAIRAFTDSLVDQNEALQELEAKYPGIIQYVKDMAAAQQEQAETVPEIEKLANAISNVRTASSLLTDIKSGKGDFLSNLSTVVDIVKSSDGETLGNFLGLKDGKLSFNTQYIEQWVNSIIDGLDASDELKNTLKEQAQAAEEAAAKFENLGNAISGIQSASTFLKNMQSGETSALDMIQSAMSMAQQLGDGHEWTDFVSGFDSVNGIKWDAAAVRAYSDALVDSALAGTELEETFPGITAWLKEMASAADQTADRLATLATSTRTAIDAGNNIGRNVQLTKANLQQLLDTDLRYAQTIDYVNGQMTINRDRYNDLTNSILQETLAEIEARTQAIVLSSEYQNLINNVGNLNAAQQARLNSLNAEIMSYGVLANELNNATSAYQRFMNSSDTDSNGRYAQAVRAMGVITDTMENKDSEIFGKIGRDQFKLAVDFVLGENVKVNTPEFEKGLATVRRYLTKDAEGVSNFYDDLISHGIIDAASGAMNTTVQEISQKLGISKEAVRSMLEELERYQAEPFDWSMLDPGEDAAAAESSIQNLEDAVAEAKAAAEDAKAAVAELSETKVTLDVSAAVSAAGSVSSALSNILTQIANINRNGKITISADVKDNTSSGNSGGGGILGNIISGVGNFFSGLFGGKSSAGGTLNAAGGKTLVGEIGPEIVVDPKTGTWRTVGIHGPEFVNLTRGSIVLNSKQTADLLGSSRTSSSGPSKAFAAQVVLADAGGGGGKASSTKTNSGGNFLTDIFNTFKNGVQNVVNNVKNFVNNAGNGVAGNVKKPTTNTTPPKNNNNNNGDRGGGGGNTKEAEEEAETLREIYEKVNNELEHLIEHQEFLYKVADRGLDFPGMEASLREQARLYRKIMENSYAAVEEMKKQGMTDTDEDLQAMERAAWSAYESMYDAFDKIRALYTDSLHEKIDNIQKAYDNLKNAMAELSDEGGISVDTFQALTQHGLQYLSFLEDADGQFRVNTDAIQQMIAAEKEQLAVETALSYVSSIQEALGDGQQNRVAALVDATQQISDNTWGAVYAQAALLKEMGLTDDQYNQVIFNINALRDLAGNVITDISDKTEQSYKDQENALDKILDFTEKLIEAETKDRIKAIENEVKAYKNIINLKKESLKVTKDENSYQRSVSEKVQEIAQLQAKIDKLALDDSRSAQAERAKLVEDLAKLQTDLSDYQADHAYEAQVTALDKMSEAYEESRQSEIDALEASISSTEKVYQLALERIRTGWSTLYTDLITWNTEQGDVINQEITENWNKAGEAVQKYGSYLAALENLRGLDVGGSLSVLPKYHGGGVVGDAGSINDSEVMAILNKGELVVDEGGKKGLYRIIDFQKNLSERLGALVGNIRLPSSAGMMPNLAMAGAGAGGGMVFSPTINVEINHNGSMSSADARKYGNDVADSALERMYNAFERRGVTGVFGTRLKQST